MIDILSISCDIDLNRIIFWENILSYTVLLLLNIELLRELWRTRFLKPTLQGAKNTNKSDEKQRDLRENVSPSWWHHQMETFSALLALCAGKSPVTGDFPAQRPVTRSFDVFFDLRLNF